jgi:galactose mutarotase-like enzyme
LERRSSVLNARDNNDRFFDFTPARATVLRSDERGLPIGMEAVEGMEYDFRQSRRIGPTVLDHAFTDLEWDEVGIAHVELRDPDHGTQISLWVDQSYPYLMLFDPLPDVCRRSLAVEPMTCPPNAFRTGDALDPAGARLLVHGSMGNRSWKCAGALIKLLYLSCLWRANIR